MTQTGFFDLYARLHAKSPHPPILVLYGFHEFLGEKILDLLVLNHLGEKSDFNFFRIYRDMEEDTSWLEVFHQAQTPGFFLDSKRLIVVMVREEKYLSLNSREKEEIRSYLEKPNLQVLLVVYITLDILRDDFKQLRKGKLETFLKTFTGTGVLHVDLDRGQDSQFRVFLKGYFAERKITISTSAIERILEIKGDDFMSVITQLPKLFLGVSDQKHLDTENVDELISGINSHSIWDLTEAIEREDAAAYLDILRYLFINGIKPTFVIGTLIAYYHKIFTAKFLLKHRFPVADIGRVLQQPSFILNKFINLVQHFPEFKIQQILNLIYRLDYESKTGGEESAKLMLQKFVFQVKGIKKS